MPYYKPVFDALIDDKRAAALADRLFRLRSQLRNELPERNISRSILVATWNIREFGR